MLYYDLTTQAITKFELLPDEITQICVDYNSEQRAFLIVTGGGKSRQILVVSLGELVAGDLVIVQKLSDFGGKVLALDLLQKKCVFVSESYQLGVYHKDMDHEVPLKNQWCGQVSNSFVNCVCLQQDEKFVFFGNHAKILVKFDLQKFEVNAQKNNAANRALYQLCRFKEKYLLASSSDCFVRLWRTADLDLLKEIDCRPKLGSGDCLYGGSLYGDFFYAFSKFGDLVRVDLSSFIVNSTCSVSARALSTGKVIKVIDSESNGMLVLDSTGKLYAPLASEILCHVNKTVFAAEIIDSLLLIGTAKDLFSFNLATRKLEKHRSFFEACFPEQIIKISGTKFAVISERIIQLHDSSNLKLVKKISPNVGRMVLANCWGNELIIGTKSGDVCSFSISSLDIVKKNLVESNQDKITCIEPLRIINKLAFGTSYGRIMLLDSQKTENAENKPFLSTGIQSVGVRSIREVCGSLVVTTGAEGFGCVYCTQKDQVVEKFSHGVSPLCFAFRANDQKIYFFGIYGEMFQLNI